jgi:hypothetical protein
MAVSFGNSINDVNMFADFLASLATTMLENSDLCGALYYTFSSPIGADDIEFCASVVWKEKDNKTPRYYSKELKRISAVKSKKYDRRFEVIDESFTGEPRAIFSMLSNEYNSALKAYGIADTLREFLYNKKRGYKYMPYAAEFLNWTNDDTTANAIQEAYLACRLASEVFEAKSRVTSRINNFKNYELQRKMEA